MRALDSLWDQTLQDFEIIVSDNSEDDQLRDICAFYGGIRYTRNTVKGMAPNTNRAMELADGYLVKILYMDDFLAHNNALKDIYDHFKGDWLVTGCAHTGYGRAHFNEHMPTWNDEIHLGVNTIGSPSVLTMRNDKKMYFDTEMTWLLDCDLYKRLHAAYGEPTYLNDVNVIIGVGDHQMTNILTDEDKMKEFNYLATKHD